MAIGKLSEVGQIQNLLITSLLLLDNKMDNQRLLSQEPLQNYQQVTMQDLVRGLTHEKMPLVLIEQH